MAEEKTKLKKYWVEQSITLALQGRWGEAVTANQNILALFPSDSEAHNRLGKAYTELGRYEEAKDAYAKALQIDPTNSIAHKNLNRLNRLLASGATGAAAAPRSAEERLDPQVFIEEMGKTGTTVLQEPAEPAMLAKLTAGDPVRLRPENSSLVVDSLRGERLGRLETKLGQRLLGLMKAGNRYAAAIASLENSPRIIIRETYQDPSQMGRLSFPPKGESGGFRSDIKGSVLKYDLDDDEGPDELDYGGEPEATGDEEEAEPAEDEFGND